jgi:hypothetical protein
MFAVSYALLLTWVLKQFLPLQSKWFLAAFIPVLAGLFDYLENASVALMLSGFPNVSERLVTAASSFTLIKSGLTSLFFVILLIALFRFAIQLVRRK